MFLLCNPCSLKVISEIAELRVLFFKKSDYQYIIYHTLYIMPTEFLPHKKEIKRTAAILPFRS